MVAMLDRVADAQYSSRLWCLFEVYVVSTEKISFEVILPEEASSEIDLLLQQGGLRQLRSAIRVDSAKAQASFIDDEKSIKKMIERMPGGYDTLNTTVRDELRRVVVADIASALDSSPIESGP
jgi:hypothetical protein